MNEVETVILILIIFALFVLSVWLYLKNDINKARVERLELTIDFYKNEIKELKEKLSEANTKKITSEELSSKHFIGVSLDNAHLFTLRNPKTSDKFKAKVKSALREIENEKRQRAI